MSDDVLSYWAKSLVIACDRCTGSPVNNAVVNLGFALDGQSRRKGSSTRVEQHVCADCLRDLWGVKSAPDPDAVLNFEPVKGCFVVLPLRRLQRKHR